MLLTPVFRYRRKFCFIMNWYFMPVKTLRIYSKTCCHLLGKFYCPDLKSLSKSFGTSRLTFVHTEVSEPTNDWPMSRATNYHFPLVLVMLLVSCHAVIFWSIRNLWDMKVTRLHPIEAVKQGHRTEQCQRILKGTLLTTSTAFNGHTHKLILL